jgi:hypothetical protein
MLPCLLLGGRQFVSVTPISVEAQQLNLHGSFSLFILPFWEIRRQKKAPQRPESNHDAFWDTPNSYDLVRCSKKSWLSLIYHERKILLH